MDNNILPIVLNGIMLAALLIPTVRGYVRGFIETAMHLLRFVIAFILSCFLSKPIGSVLKDKWLYGFFHEKILGSLLESTESLTNGEAMTNALPVGIRPILEAFGVNVGAVADDAAGSGEAMVESFAETIADKISGVVGVAIAFVGVFLIGLILVSIFSKILSALVEHLPIVGTINKILGLVFGGVIGVITAWVLSQLIVTVLGAFTNVDYTQIYLLDFFHSISLVRWILQLFMSAMTGIV